MSDIVCSAISQGLLFFLMTIYFFFFFFFLSLVMYHSFRVLEDDIKMLIERLDPRCENVYEVSKGALRNNGR